MAALALSAAGGVRRYLVFRRENSRLVRETETLGAEVESKRALILLAKDDPDLMEGEARRQLGLIGEGEIEFRFVPSAEGGPERMESRREGNPT